jgi:hypothetical protein
LSEKSRHIADMLEDLYGALDEVRPWSLVRLGDGEKLVLDGLHAPWKYHENWCSSVGDAGELRQATIEAIRGADWVGWHQDAGLVEWMENIGQLPALYERSVFAWVNLHMPIRRGFVERVLRGQQLFLVGEPMIRWLDEILRPNGLGANAEVYARPVTPKSWKDVLRIMDAVHDTSARVVLASLGVWAPAVAHFAKKWGKIGIDFGHTPDHHLKPVCDAHRDRWGQPANERGTCGASPDCQAHWRYLPNWCCEESPAGTMEHYGHAGCAGQCLPEKGY